MIRYEWRTQLTGEESAEVRSLLEAAAVYDGEPEFSGIDPVDVERDLAQGDSSKRLLLIWMLPRMTRASENEEPECLAGVLRMVVDADGVGDVDLVIAPGLRSLGIVTLFVERVGLDVAADHGGWLGSGATALRSWAQGNHPAARRLSDRHFIPRTQRIWKLIRQVDEPGDPSLPLSRVRMADTDSENRAALTDFVGRTAASSVPCPDLVRDVEYDRKTVLVAADVEGTVVGALTLNRTPVVSVEFGKCGVAEYVSRDPADDDPPLTRALLEAAFEHARDAGLEGVVVHVDSENTGLVNACRLTRFQHDRTDVRFEL